jgi:urea transporter
MAGAAGFLSAWAKLGPTRAGTAATATANATNFFMTLLLGVTRVLAGHRRGSPRVYMDGTRLR